MRLVDRSLKESDEVFLGLLVFALLKVASELYSNSSCFSPEQLKVVILVLVILALIIWIITESRRALVLAYLLLEEL